jgi:hypothetical protein
MRLELESIVGERFHGAGVGAVEGSTEYRIGYYIVNRRGRWHWGQYALMIPAGDLRSLLAKALDEGTIRPQDLSFVAEDRFHRPVPSSQPLSQPSVSVAGISSRPGIP